MKKYFLSLILMTALIISSTELSAQVYDPNKGCVIDANGQCVPNTILSALPFLRIIPDARSGAMGDVGLATSVDANAIHFNSAKLAFVEQDLGFAASYTPWLRDLGLDDVYLTYLGGFKKIDDLQSIGASIRFFSLGEIQFTDINGNPTGDGKPREMEFALAYSRKLGENFSAGLTGKYLYSNLASGQRIGNLAITSANAVAVDLGIYYKKKMKLSSYDSNLAFGMAVSNVGNKVTYTQSAEQKDFLPMNIGLGSTLTIDFDEYNSISFSLDLNKLLLPTPCAQFEGIDNQVQSDCWSNDGDAIPDYRQQGMFSALTGSFSDAQGGFGEELQEINYSLGMEYWYDKQFAFRLGSFFENELKGNRKYFTMGVGLKYNVFGLNLSYLVPTNNQRNPLDNTLRFTINFDFADAEAR